MNMSTNINNNLNANSGVRQVTRIVLAAVLLAAGCASAMANVLPQVKILSVESNGASPATIKLDADATDSDGSIAKVEFFSGTTLIGTAMQAPFTFTWTGAAAGAYSVTAKATDNLGASSVTVATSVVVGSSPAKAYYVHSDQIDTAKLITNDAGQAVWKSDLEPFGANLPDENPQRQGAFVFNNRFPGQYSDRETGLHYNFHRDYDPQTGRYVESDPIGLSGGINTYGYVEGNPTSNVDPSGLFVAPGVPTALLPVVAPVAKGAGATLATGGAAAAAALAGGVAIGLVINEAYEAIFDNSVGSDLYDVAYPEVRPLTLAQTIELSSNQMEVKNICREPVPKNLTPCETAKWKLVKALRCELARTRIANKFFGGLDQRHIDHGKTVTNQVNSARELVDRHCRPGCK
jgi:RHS repeat-associated protein